MFELNNENNEMIIDLRKKKPQSDTEKEMQIPARKIFNKENIQLETEEEIIARGYDETNSSGENIALRYRSQKKRDFLLPLVICLLVFGLPLLFLPWTINILDFSKQTFLVIGGLVGLILWLAKILASGEVRLNFSLLNIPVIILLIVSGASTFFSLWRYGSFWGLPFSVSQSFLSLVGFVVLYFLVANVFTKKSEVWRLLIILIASGFLVAVFGGLQIFGKFLLPLDITKNTSFNTIGTVNSLGMFLAILLPLAIALAIGARNLWIRLLLVLFALPIAAILFLINFWAAWLVLLAGSATLFIFAMTGVKKLKSNRWIILPMFLLVSSLFFLTFRISLPGVPALPLEVSLTQKTELDIAKNIIAKSPFLGTGPGTFVYDYSKAKSEDLNQTAFWNIRFESGASEILDKLITTGVIGLVALLALFAIFFWQGTKHLRKSSNLLENESLDKQDWFLGLGIFSSFASAVLSLFVYPVNLSLLFLFWIIIGSLAAVESKRVKIWVLEPSSARAIAVSFSLVLILVFGMGISFVGIQRFLGETKYFESLKAWQKGEIDSAIRHLSDAINLNPNSDIYWQNISQLYLLRLNEILQNPALPQEAVNVQSQTFIGQAINSTGKAVEIAPANVANWNVRGFVYRNVIGTVGGAEEWAIKSYDKARELEPTNPYIITEIGRVYLAKAERAEQQNKEDEKTSNLTLALENFNKAIELKRDYAPAHFQIAIIYIRQAKTKEAIAKLEETKILAPFDSILFFQLGMIYYNDKQFDNAQRELERTILLDPNYSNARYILGLIYDRQKQKDKAIQQFERIASLNPDNEEVKKILANLKAGKEALEGTVNKLPEPEPKESPLEGEPVR